MQQINLEWANFKAFVDSRSLSIQYLELNDSYYLFAFDGTFSTNCFISLSDSTNVADFETNYKDKGNKSPKTEVVTQFEKDDKILKLACGSSEVDSEGYAEVELKIPGTYAEGTGRYIDGGRTWFDVAHTGDKIVSIIVIDKDGVFGYGPNIVARVWHDEGLDEENQGWYIPKSAGGIAVDSIGGYGFIPSQLYLQIKAKKGENQTQGTLFLNLKWGREE